MAEKAVLPNLTLINGATFYDRKPESNTELAYLRSSREHTAGKHLRELFPFAHTNYQSILQIGPGTGGETRAIQQLKPGTPVLGIDFDPDPLLRASAIENGIPLLEVDVLDMRTDDIASLLDENHIDTIIAFRSPAAVLIHLLRELPAAFRGSFIFSLWSGPDFHYFGELAQYVKSFGGDIFILENGERGIPNEVGYVLNFPLVEAEQVA